MIYKPAPQRLIRDEGERPFWISYADLMTALMILFLVVMVVALSQISNAKTEQTVQKENPLISQRESAISSICEQLSSEASKISSSIRVDCALNRIGFGEIGQYKAGQYVLNEDAQNALYQLIPTILQTANSDPGQKWLKQVVIEGFTDTDGSYLYNLNLSLKRSEWVMCAIFGQGGNNISLSPDQLKQIKKLFLVGGVSFNDAKQTKEASRRIELRLQFYGLDETQATLVPNEEKFEIQPGERCHI